MKPIFKRIVIMGLLLLLLLALHRSGVTKYLTFEYLKMQRLYLQQCVARHYFKAAILYISAYVMVTAAALPGAAALTIIGGFLFGAILATLYTNIGATTGALCVFSVLRYVAGHAIQVRYEKQLEHFNSAMQQYGTYFLLAVRLLPIFPFFLVNVFTAFTNISLWTFAWTTMVGIIPGSFVYAFAGQQLQDIDSPKDIFSWKVGLAFVLLAIFSLLPIFFTKYRNMKQSTQFKE